MSSPDRAFSLPVGTVTFLLTDVEGSTRMWSSEPADAMRAAIARHHDLLAEAVDRNGGVRPQERVRVTRSWRRSPGRPTRCEPRSMPS